MNRPTIEISIHSLRMEGDIFRSTIFLSHVEFQSTPSAWRETYHTDNILSNRTFQSTPSAWRETPERFTSDANEVISIHSLRMEGDKSPA